MRVSVLNGRVKDNSKVVSLSSDLEEDMYRLVDKIEKELDLSSGNLDTKLAALGKILEKLLEVDGGEK